MLTTAEIKQIIAGKSSVEQLRLIGEMMSEATDAVDRSLLLAEKGKVLWRAGRNSVPGGRRRFCWIIRAT